MAAGGVLVIPAFVSRVAANLEAEPLADVLRLSSVLLESAREMISAIAGAEAAAEIDAVYKPFVRVLLLRALELEHHPPSRGNA